MSPSCVVKIGGSVLGTPDLARRLDTVLDDFSRPHPIAVQGGGELVECLRRWDRLYAIGEEDSHWLALRALSITSGVLERICPRFRHVLSPEEFARTWQSGRVPLLDAWTFIREIDEKRADPLPRRWRVTTDSIAARMAESFGAPEVVLVKSTDVLPGTTRSAAAAEGIVDPHFPSAAVAVARVVVVNLRAEPPLETELAQV